MKYDANVKENAVKMAQDGKTLAEIHKETGIPKGTLSGWINNTKAADAVVPATITSGAKPADEKPADEPSITIETSNGKHTMKHGATVVTYETREKPPVLTREEYGEYKADTYDKMTKLCSALNEAESSNLPVAKTLAAHLDNLKNLYNEASVTEAFMRCLEHENPLLCAVTDHLYETVQVKGGKTSARTVQKVNKRIPIDRLYRHTNNGVGVDKDWFTDISKYVRLVKAYCIIDKHPGDDPAEAIREYCKRKPVDYSDIIGAIEKWKANPKNEKNPVSKTSMIAALADLISKMIGDEYGKKVIKVDDSEVKKHIQVEDKSDAHGLTDKIISNGKLYDLIAKVAYRVATGGRYDIA